MDEFDYEPDYEDWIDPVQADAEVLAMAGMGTYEDYRLIGGDSDLWGEY